jgi:hypothetical protein
MSSPGTYQALNNLRSNLQKAQSARSWKLLQGERDFDKRANGVNATIKEGLQGDFDPVRFISQEKPVHRTMVNMCAAGYTNKEISDFTGYCVVTVATVLKQPWARQYLIKEAKKTVQDEIKEILEREAPGSLKVLVAVRDNTSSRDSDRLTAANSLLDRFLGKPTQPISHEQKPPSEMTDEELRKQVEAELASQKQEDGTTSGAA